MASPFSSVEIVNTALELIAAQTTIASLTDGSPAADAANTIYQPVIQLMMREMDPAFARFTAPLVVAVNPSQVPQWAWEYAYPVDCVRLRQVLPPTGYDVNDPQPIRANVGFDVIATVNALEERLSDILEPLNV